MKLPRWIAAIALATWVVPPLASAQETRELGRLFFDRRERAELDRRRQQPPPRPSAPPRADAAVPVETPAGPPPDVTVNGYVIRDSGRSTAWINDRPFNDQYRIREGSRVTVPYDEARRQVPLKPGQTYGAESGTRDGLAGGRIEIRRQ